MSETGSVDEIAESVLDFFDAHGWKTIAVLTAVGIALPFVGLGDGFYMTVVSELYLFAVLALSWDLIGGQTGYPSFGQMGFFGIGAYTTAILVKDFAGAFPAFLQGDELTLFLGALVIAGVFATAAAGAIGAVVLRLRGGYFAIATLGILLTLQQVTKNLEITGGASGKILFTGPTAIEFYYVFLAILVVEVSLVYYLTNTRFGYVLNAIKDDEEKATAMGINTTYYKTAAWMLAGLFTGLVGGTYSLFNTFVNPQVGYNLAWNVELIAMALLGGTGTVAGPVLGAFGLHALIVLVIDTMFTGWQLFVLGAVVIVTVIAFPQGLVGTLREKASAMEYYRHGGQAADESPGGEEPADDGAATDGGEMA